MRLRFFFACGVAAILAACSGGQSVPGTRPPEGASKKTSLVIHIRVPKKHRKHARYISPSTQAIQFSLVGPTNAVVTAALTPTATGCSGSPGATTCTLSVPIAPCPSTSACYTATIATYDAISGCPSACSVTGANELSANVIPLAVVAGVANQFNATLDGVPASVTLVPDGGSTLGGNSTTGFTLAKCTTTTQGVTMVVKDAGNNAIVGPGSPVGTLGSDDATHLAVVTPAPSASPDHYVLTPPASLAAATIPAANHVVHLTATETPPSGSGVATLTQHVTVTFGGDVCGVLTETSVGKVPTGITAGPDGNVWEAEFQGQQIGRVTPSGTVTENSANGKYVWGITSGPDGNLWYTDKDGANIVKMSTAGSIISSYSLTTGGSLSEPQGIAAGPDGNLWFTECKGNYVGKVTTSGTVTEYSIPTAGSAPLGITAGPDGALWFAESGAAKIGRVTTAGVVTEYTTGLIKPEGIAAGPDGDLWFTTSGAVGQMTTAGTMANHYTANIAFSDNAEHSIVAGPDGALWFTETCADKIGRITTAGSITEYSGLHFSSDPLDITVGPDGALWFTEHCYTPSNVARLQ